MNAKTNIKEHTLRVLFYVALLMEFEPVIASQRRAKLHRASARCSQNLRWVTRKSACILQVLFSTKFAAARQVKWLRREMHLWCVKYPLTRMLKGKFHFTESAAHYFTICVKQIISHRAVREIFHCKIINMCYQ